MDALFRVATRASLRKFARSYWVFYYPISPNHEWHKWTNDTNFASNDKKNIREIVKRRDSFIRAIRDRKSDTWSRMSGSKIGYWFIPQNGYKIG